MQHAKEKFKLSLVRLKLMYFMPVSFQVFNAVNSSLSTAAGEAYSSLQHQLWEAIDNEISLAECDIYRYNWIKYKMRQHFENILVLWTWIITWSYFMLYG